ncbi:hypothetical protein MSAS_02640 [Mycobacterium saskatchewanense]|nr:hypothetical protein MSAS_02640 [Mycobacterium saskatchewanense]
MVAAMGVLSGPPAGPVRAASIPGRTGRGIRLAGSEGVGGFGGRAPADGPTKDAAATGPTTA